MRRRDLKARIRASLKAQGFVLRNGSIVPPDLHDKDTLRSLHALSVAHRVERARPRLERHEIDLVARLATTDDVLSGDWNPRLIEVRRRSEEELLFRWAALHWSIPVSSGYGRRLRFLVLDGRDRLIGLIGLADPVFALRGRDNWIGWDEAVRKERLANVMDAFVLGAVPPYSSMLGGKLIAMLATSDEVREAFKRKYRGCETRISGRQFDGRLALLTTTSALGRSSVYNRLQYEQRRLFESVGYTLGFGEFHFSDGLYSAITEFALEHCAPTAKAGAWGTGFRSRRELVRKSLMELGLPADRLLQHGVRREIFVAPLAENSAPFLRGDASRLRWNRQSAAQLWEGFRARWMLPRLATRAMPDWSPEMWHLWGRHVRSL